MHHMFITYLSIHHFSIMYVSIIYHLPSIYLSIYLYIIYLSSHFLTTCISLFNLSINYLLMQVFQ